jgi:hypothetical protein
MATEVHSGPEVMLRSDDLKACIFCTNAPVPTFQPQDGISARANHYVNVHELPIVADYEKVLVRGNPPVRFIELDKQGVRSEQGNTILPTQGLLPKAALQPLCLEHGRRMIRIAPASGAFVHFRCTVPDCGFIWDKPAGYGRETGHTLPYRSSGSPICPKFMHGSLFVESWSKDQLGWKCPVMGCEEKKTTARLHTQTT